MNKPEYAIGDLVRHTGRFLRSIGWCLDVPIDGKVLKVRTLGKLPLLVVLWNDTDEPSSILAVNVEKCRYKANERVG